MKLVNRTLNILNKFSLGRLLLKNLIFLRYKQKGRDIKSVNYLPEYRVWESRIGSTIYLCSGPGWAYDHDFLLEQLKYLSCNQYLPKSGDLVIDVGAGIGEETVIFSMLVGLKGKVFAIEAHPKTFKALNYLKESNGLNNVVCSNIALSNQAGTVDIEDNDNSLANSILQVSKGKSFAIPAETFDTFVERNNIETIDFLKMNVEGAEQLIVQGMTKSLSKIKHLSISCHDFRFLQGESEFFKTKKIIVNFLTQHNFKISTQHSSVSMVDDYVYASNPNLP